MRQEKAVARIIPERQNDRAALRETMEAARILRERIASSEAGRTITDEDVLSAVREGRKHDERSRAAASQAEA